MHVESLHESNVLSVCVFVSENHRFIY